MAYNPTTTDLFKTVRPAFMPADTDGDAQAAIDTAILGVAGPVAAALAAQATAEAAQAAAEAAVAYYVQIATLDEVIDMHITPAASWDLSIDIPIGAVILSAQANLQDDISAVTATKVGLGTAADPDKYGKTADLITNSKIDTIPAHAVLAGAEDIQLFAVDNAGDAAGTIGGGATGTDEVRVQIVYQKLVSLPSV